MCSTGVQCYTGPVDKANLTLSIEAELLRRARVRAAERGTSVNALVRDYLTRLAGEQRERSAAHNIVALAERSGATSGSGGRTWTRDDLYDR